MATPAQKAPITGETPILWAKYAAKSPTPNAKANLRLLSE